MSDDPAQRGARARPRAGRAGRCARSSRGAALLLALPLPRGPVAVAAGGVDGRRRAGRDSCARCAAAARARVGAAAARSELRRSVVGTRSFLVDVHLLGR